MILIIACIFSCIVSADRLPNQTPENQIFTIDTVIDATGSVDDANSMSWVVASPGAIPTGQLGYNQVIADVTYKDSLLTNGGKISENKNFDFDSGDQAKGLYNIETEKVVTYASTEGAHMVGEEEYTLSVAGNWANVNNNIRCVFSGDAIGVPAFCNIISAKSNLININSAQISTKGVLRAVTNTIDVPTEMSYRIAVSPDANSGSGFAEGTVSTVFAGSIMEARNGNDYTATSPTWNKTAAERTWKDSTTVTGGIKNFQKVFGDPSYLSGVFNPQDAPAFSSADTTPSPTPEQTGTVVIVNTPGSYWYRLIGPQDTHEGYGPITFTNMPLGHYEILGAKYTYHPSSGDLSAGGTITFIMDLT